MDSLVYRSFTHAIAADIILSRLDRTNVVQSTFAKWAITQQLRQAGVLGAKETVDDHQDFIYLYRNGVFEY